MDSKPQLPDAEYVARLIQSKQKQPQVEFKTADSGAHFGIMHGKQTIAANLFW
jgi:hypothetical protein